MNENKNIAPPKWIDRLLGYLLDGRLYEGVIGDLDEKYSKRIVDGRPRWKANLFYVLEAFGFVRMMKWSSFFKFENSTVLYGNYMLVALRNISRDRLYVFLNVIGLAIGMACIVVIYSYVRFELSYEQFHKNGEKIYRVTEEYMEDAQLVQSATNHAPLATIISENVSGIDKVVRIFPYSMFFNSFVSADPEHLFKESGFCYADSLFFSMFTFESLTGPLDHALDAPFSVVLTRKTAEKYFGSVETAVGKTLNFQTDEESLEFNVTSVIENIPQNSHFSFDFLASFSSLDVFMPWYNNWHHPSMFIYIQMLEHSDPVKLQQKIESIARTHEPDYVREENRLYGVQPIRGIHLNSRLEYEWEANSDASYIRIFIIVGIFVLLIACINFMNIATARATRRGREVGVRKVLGGKKGQLVTQFLAESFIYVTASFLVGVVIAEISLHFFFNDIIRKSLSVTDFLTWEAAGYSIVFLVLISVLSGLYPSFYLSAMNPIGVMKGKMLSGGSPWLRKSLVTFQFFISCLLISTTFIVMQQVDYLKNKNLGFAQEHVINIKLTDRYSQKNYEILRNMLLAESDVAGVALSSTLPGNGNFYGCDIVPEGGDPNNPLSIKTLGVDEGFVSTYQLELVEGRDFSADIQTDQRQAFILNEAAAKKLNWSDPIDKQLELKVYIEGPVLYKGRVIGLVKDFNFQSLHSTIEPLLLYINKHPYYADHLSVRFKNGDITNSVEMLREKWSLYNPDKPIDFQFLDDQLGNLYSSESKVSRIFNVLALISIVVACLGLFGLSTYMAERRTKEVGIRKIMGASTLQMFTLQIREFILLVLIANVLVCPLAIWWSNDWLSDFAYHISIGPAIFILTLLGAISLVVLTLSYHTSKVARTNPADTLRYE